MKDGKQIVQVSDMPGVAGSSATQPRVTPVVRNYFENWNIRVVDRQLSGCDNYMSPNRRDFYKIMFMTSGTGLLTLGMNTYYIEEPTILFLHPHEIVTWRNLSDQSGGVYCLFKKRYVEQHPTLKSVIDNHKLFTDKQVIQLSGRSVKAIQKLFSQMLDEAKSGWHLAEEAMQAYLQLIMIESQKEAHFPAPDSVSEDYRHVRDFFELLEEETATINLDNPIRLHTAKEFAGQLNLHPNHLNALLKKHTGETVSTHIKNRLLDESKALLRQTDWNLQQIGQCIGFAEQPNFSQFFKKNMGITPDAFRKMP